MKFKPLTTVIIIIAILVVSILGYSSVKAMHNAAQAKKSGKRDLSVAVQTGKVGRTHIEEILTFNGDIQAMQSVDLQSKVAGRILSLELEDGTAVEEGLAVKQGQLVARIDDRDLKAQLAKAEAAVSAARAAQSVANANVVSAEASILNAKASMEQRNADLISSKAALESSKAALDDKEREMNRQKKLLEKQATTQQNFDQAMTAFDQASAEYRKSIAKVASSEAEIRSAEANIQQAEANLQRYKANVMEADASMLQAEANLEQVQVNFSETRLYSPMNGVVARKSIDPGAMVSSNTTIVNIQDMDTVKVIIAIPVKYLPDIIPGKTNAVLTTVSLPNQEIPCRIEKVYPAVDKDTRTAQVEIRIKNMKNEIGAYQLRPGMYATVAVTATSRDNILAIDSALPIRVLERNVVYRVKGDKVEAVDVKLGVRFNKMVEVLSGLDEGDEIVIVGQHRLTDGAAIKVISGNNLELNEQ